MKEVSCLLNWKSQFEVSTLFLRFIPFSSAGIKQAFPGEIFSYFLSIPGSREQWARDGCTTPALTGVTQKTTDISTGYEDPLQRRENGREFLMTNDEIFNSNSCNLGKGSRTIEDNISTTKTGL